MATVKYNVSKKIQIEIQGSQSEIWAQLASADELFSNEPCGVCGSEDVSFKVRRVPDPKSKKGAEFVYFEKQCNARGCRAKLKIGQHNNDEKTLYPDRKLPSGEYDVQCRGWEKYDPNKKQEN